MISEKGRKIDTKKLLSDLRDGVNIDKIKEFFKALTREQSELSVMIRLAIGVVLLILAGLGIMPGALGKAIRTASFLLCAYDMVFVSFRSIRAGKLLSPEILITISGVLAFFFGTFSEAVLFIVIYRVFSFLTRRIVNWARRDTVNGLDLRSAEIRLFKDDKIVVVPADSVMADDVYMVTPGDVIPLDGVVISGASELDTEPVTGDTVTRKVQKDSVVLSGCVNVTGTLMVRATSDLKGSVVTRRMEFMDSYETFETKVEKSFEGFRAIYVLTVCGIAVLVGAGVPALMGNFPRWLHTASVLLAAASPVPLFAATAIAYYSQLGDAAGKGILIRNKETADRLNRVSSVVFDKAGTLFTGRLEVKSVESQRLSDKELLMLASYALAGSESRIAGVVKEASGITPDMNRIKKSYEEDGKCSIVQLKDGRVIAAGSREMLEMMEIPAPPAREGYTALYVCVGRDYAGCIYMCDKVRADAFEAVTGLRAMSVKRVSVITSDPEENCDVIAEGLGAHGAYHAVTSEEKAAVLDELSGDDVLVYLGSGSEDPSLYGKADVGAAMNGLVSPAAMENADAVFVKSEPSKLCDAVRASRIISKTVKTNLALVGAATLIPALIAVFGSMKLWAFAFIQSAAVVLAVLIAVGAYGFFEKHFPEDQKAQ